MENLDEQLQAIEQLPIQEQINELSKVIEQLENQLR